MMRGNERKNIFLNDEDRSKFLDILYEKKKGNKYLLYAYCLMDNHVHLVISENKEDISRIMKRINTSYAYYFNNRYARVGHLFQDRFKSEPIAEDEYLLTAIRYIHNNPVKANIVEKAVDYRWSSIRAFLNPSLKNKLVDKEFILGIFNESQIAGGEKLFELTSKWDLDKTLEYEEDNCRMNEGESILFIKNYLNIKNIAINLLKTKGGMEYRVELIRELKQRSNLSIRKIARLLDITRGQAQKLKA